MLFSDAKQTKRMTNLEIYLELQKKILLSGKRIKDVAKERGTHTSHLKAAFVGELRGPRFRKLVRDLCAEYNLRIPFHAVEAGED